LLENLSSPFLVFSLKKHYIEVSMTESTSLKEQRKLVAMPEKSFFLPELAEQFGIIVRVDEKSNELIRLSENTGLQRTKKIHRAAVAEFNITREDLVFYVDEGVVKRGGAARRQSLENVEMGSFIMGVTKTSPDEMRRRSRELTEVLGVRAQELEEVLEINGMKQQIHWDEKKDGLWMKSVWEVAAELRKGKKFKTLTSKQQEAWGCLGASQQETTIIYQELMEYYNISPESMFDGDGILKTVGGENLSTTISNLNERQRTPALYEPRRQRYQEWVDYQKKLSGAAAVITIEVWQKERYERYKLREKPEGKELMSFKDWQKVDNLKMDHEEDLLKIRDNLKGDKEVGLADLMSHIENKRMGDVVHAYLSTEMERFLDRAYGGESQLPVSYAIASESGREGIIFTNFFGNRIHDEMVTALRASGDFFFWEAVGRLERMIRFTQTGFGENRLTKESWSTLEGVSPPVIQFILLNNKRLGRAFGEALMLPEIIGVRDWRTGRPGMYADFDSHGVAQPPTEDQPMGVLAPNKRLRESARRKMEDAGYPRWLADLAMAHSWMSGEGIDLAQSMTKPRNAEEGIYGLIGAVVEPWFDYDGKGLNDLQDSSDEKGWGREYAFRVLRWLTPGPTPFMTLTHDAWKLMSLSPWARELWFASFYMRMPAYGWVNKQDKERLRLVMEKLNFSGPYKNIWERYLGEMEHREQKRWGTYFHIVDDKKLMDLGGKDLGFWRYPFDFNNPEHVQSLAKLMTKGVMAEKVKAKMKLLGVPGATVDAWTEADMVGLINNLNNRVVREGANTLQTQWFDSSDVEIEATKLIGVNSKQVAYNAWQNTLEAGDRKPWSGVTIFQQSNNPLSVAAKLELVLRDLDTWGLKANTTKPEILSRLADLGERLDGSLARYFFTTAYGYEDHAGQDDFMESFPDISMPISPKELEKAMVWFDEYPKRTGGLPHVSQFHETLVFRLWFFKQIAEIRFEKIPGLGPGFPRGGSAKEPMFDPELRKELADILEQT